MAQVAETALSNPQAGDPKPSLFTVYKSGRGYWTRLGTAIAAGMLVLVLAYFINRNMRVWLADVLGARAGNITAIVTGVFVVIAGLFAWAQMNKPRNVEFLIETDSEMKKVNWASRKELFGSTRVVVIFLVIIAFTLFFMDFASAWFFHQIGVLKVGPSLF